MFLKLLAISLFFMFLVFAGLGIRILFKKNGTFPETHVGHNKEMRKRGISCATSTDTGCSPADNDISCCSCSIRD